MGNAFLSNITAVDGIFHVLRTFEDPDITHVEDRVDPVDDMQIIHAELRAKDLERVDKVIEARPSPPPVPHALTAPAFIPFRLCGQPCRSLLRVPIAGGTHDGVRRAGPACVQTLAVKKVATKEEKEDLEAARKVKAVLEEGKDIRHADWNLKETAFLNQTQFISAKPVVYLVNMSEKDFLRKKNKHLPKVMEYVKANGGDPVIPYSAAFEQSIFDMPPEDQEKARARCCVCSACCGAVGLAQRAPCCTSEPIADAATARPTTARGVCRSARRRAW